MAFPSPISFDDKQDRQTNSLDRKYKATAADFNDLKGRFNDLLAYLQNNVTQTIRVKIEAADFNGTYYENADLAGLTPDVDFQLFTDNGSGTLMNYTGDADDGYNFDSATARIYTYAGSYLLIIHKPIS